MHDTKESLKMIGIGLAFCGVLLGVAYGIAGLSRTDVHEVQYQELPRAGAPVVNYQQNLLPQVTDRFDLGSSTPAFEWNGLYVKTICLSGDCKTAWPAGGAGSGGGVATTSLLATFPNIVTKTVASITFSNAFSTTSDTGLTSNRFVVVNAGGILGTVASSGLALPNTALQNSSVTINGVSVSLGGTGTIASTTLLGDNNTFSGNTTFSTIKNSLVWMNGSSVLSSTSTPTAAFFIATSTTASSTFNGVSATLLNVTGAGTSTFSNGIQLTDGCFYQQGTCLDTLITAAGAFKQAVKYASTSTLPSNSYNNGVAGVGATLTGVANGPFYIDGNTPTVGDRVLVKNEGTGANNGIYTVTTLGVAGLTAFVLTRATDYNSSTDVYPGVANFTNSGTQNANTCWILTNTSSVTIGTTALTYDDACGAGSFSGTYPILVSGTTISTAFGTSTTWSTGQVAYVNANGNVSSVATGTVSATLPLSVTAGRACIGGACAFSIADAVADGATKGAAAYTANDFDAASGVISLDYTNAQKATASINGFLTSTDWSTFNSKLNFSNLFAKFTTYATSTIGTTTPTYFSTAFYASSTLAVPSVIDNFTSSNSTTTSATSTTFAILNAASALLLTNSGGSVGKYAGSNPCSNQVALSLSATGVISCSSITDAMISGTIGNTHGGTGQDSSAWSGVPVVNSGTWSSSSTLATYRGGTGTSTASSMGTVLAWNGVNWQGYATSTLYGTCTAGQVIGWSGTTGTLVCMATSSPAGAVAGGTNGMLTSWLGATTLTSTSSPQVAAIYATSSVATSTFAGWVQMGSSTTKWYPMTPLQITANGNAAGELIVQNLSSGAVASGDVVVGGDLMSTSTYYTDLGCNSSGNTDATFSIAGVNDCYLYTQDTNLNIGVASSTASLRFFTGGTLAGDEVARMTPDSRMLIGTTSSAWGLLTVSSSTIPQITLTDNSLTNNGWSFRAIANNLFFATSTPTATSTIASMMMNGRTGNVMFPQGLISQASSTFAAPLWSAISFGIATSTLDSARGIGFVVATSTMFDASVGSYYGSSTAPGPIETIIWSRNLIRVMASTTHQIEITSTSSRPLDGGRYILKVCQDGVGGRSVTFTNYSSGLLNFSMGTPTPPTAKNTGFLYGMIYDARVGRYDVVAATSTPSASCAI